MTTLAYPRAPYVPPPLRHPDEQRFVLHDVGWESYIAIGRVFADRPALRLTYDRGNLELMTTSPRHECYKHWLGRFLETLAEELSKPIAPGGSMTFQRDDLERGFEPDNCYWIGGEQAMRGKLAWMPATDPPPDVMIEIEISRSAVARMPIFAAFRIPEIWRYDGEKLRIEILQADGTYQRGEKSLAFSLIPVQDLVRFFPTETMDYLSAVAAVRAWVRSMIDKPK